MIRQSEQNLEARERRAAEARSLNLFSDVFMTAVLQDPAACQHVLRILTGIEDLSVKTVRTQYRISRISSHDAILDVLAEDKLSHLHNIEVQRTDTVNHARRTRFYSSMIDSEYLQKGNSYDEMPDIHMIYISKTDLWKAGKTLYPVRKYLGDSDLPYEDGVHILYVNAAVNDESPVAHLMNYFKTADPNDMSQGDLSKRVHFLKSEEGGYQVMCEISEKWFREGEEQGRIEGARKTALELKKMGLPLDKIAKAVNFSVDTVTQWLTESPSVTK